MYDKIFPNNVYISLVQTFNDHYEIAYITEQKRQYVQFYNWFENKHPEGQYLEPSERSAKLDGNDVIALKYHNKTLIALT